MGSRIKKFNVTGDHRKIWFLGSCEKPVYRGRLSEKGELWQCADLGRGLNKEDGDGVFEGGYPNVHYDDLDIVTTL